MGMPCVRLEMIGTGTLWMTLNRAEQRVPVSAEGRVHLQFGYDSLVSKQRYRQAFQRFFGECKFISQECSQKPVTLVKIKG